MQGLLIFLVTVSNKTVYSNLKRKASEFTNSIFKDETKVEMVFKSVSTIISEYFRLQILNWDLLLELKKSNTLNQIEIKLCL